jgi:hypothetical protein
MNEAALEAAADVSGGNVMSALLHALTHARDSGNAPNWSSTNSLNVSSGIELKSVFQCV